jgi:hydrogenase nickel incorporation protein HypB
MSKQKIRVYRDIVEVNAQWSNLTRKLLKDQSVVMLNIIGSPGCGKTTLLEQTCKLINQDLRLAILEGDIETTRDAERLKDLGIPVSQLITGGTCHLQAQLINQALNDLPLNSLDMVIVENVGNLVCPAGFDIGENAKLAVLSITEGEDKPLKYPLLFREAGAIILTKTDLLPHLNFNLDECISYIKQINSEIPIFQVSAFAQKGMQQWIEWIREFAQKG